MKQKLRLLVKEFLLLITLLLLAVAVNWPIINFDLMYFEQATIFNANQAIHSLADLIHVYTHPQMLDFVIPFFRPSGHFLLYQLLTPFIGWYNTQALFIVNMLFLGLAGYMMVKLYQALFSGLKVGGYIAFSIYVMNPALLISKITIMHFEFAYVFLVLWSLYCFVLFCQKNCSATDLSPLKFYHSRLLAASIVLYIIAGTFKEAAVMLGPVLACYLIIAIYKPKQMTQAFKNKDVLAILGLLAAASIALALYLTMSWHGDLLPGLYSRTFAKSLLAAKQFSVYFFSLTHDYIPEDPTNHLTRATQTPPLTHYIIWGLLFVTAISLINVFRQTNVEFKKSLLFLLLALIIFMFLPVMWGVGFGWHLGLSLVCEAMILGFGIEFYARHFINKEISNLAGASLAILICYAAYQVDLVNVRYVAAKEVGFFSRVNHNAVFHPPPIKPFLNDESILIVQDNLNIGDYQLGNSTYPYMMIAQPNSNFDTFFNMDQRNLFWRVKPNYNGTLFHWAYALPNLKEEVIPFTDANLRVIPDAILASWLRHINNIFCVTYDAAGNWFDNTVTFKRNIVLEQKRRHLFINQYHVLPLTVLQSDASTLYRLPYADPELCKTLCDSNHSCKGFTYNDVVKDGKTRARCFFYKKINAAKKPCAICTGYIKLKVS